MKNFKKFILLFVVILNSCSVRESQVATNSVQKPNSWIKEFRETKEKNGLQVSSETILEVEFVRGVVYNSKDHIIGEIATITVDEKNQVYIADEDQTTIHVFSPDGNYLTSLGREGRGPGEFTAVYERSTTMDIHSNWLYVTDFIYGSVVFPHRINVFSLEDLSFSHTINLIPSNKNEYKEKLEGYYPKRIYPRNDGLFLAVYHRRPSEYRDAESFIRYVIQDSVGNIMSDPIFEQKDLTYLTYTYPSEITHMHSFPFFEKSLFIVSDDDHLYFANTKEFSIDIYDLNHSHVRNIKYPFNNKIFNKEEIIDYYDKINYMTQLDRYKGDKIALQMIHDAENLPETWPALNEMLIDDENRLWISTIVEDFDIYEWWILEDNGELITKFEWPRDEPIEAVRNSYMYTRETDEETDLQQVVRYRIEKRRN